MSEERTSHHARALGSIDTFRFEEAATRAAALGAIVRGEWEAPAETFATERTPERCFWVKRSPALQRTWEIIRQAAATGRALESTRKALERSGSLDETVERYVDKLAPVDRAHRLFEQRAHALMASISKTMIRCWRCAPQFGAPTVNGPMASIEASLTAASRMARFLAPICDSGPFTNK